MARSRASGWEGFVPNLRPGLRFQFLKGLSVCNDFKWKQSLKLNLKNEWYFKRSEVAIFSCRASQPVDQALAAKRQNCVLTHKRESNLPRDFIGDWIVVMTEHFCNPLTDAWTVILVAGEHFRLGLTV